MSDQQRAGAIATAVVALVAAVSLASCGGTTEPIELEAEELPRSAQPDATSGHPRGSAPRSDRDSPTAAPSATELPRETNARSRAESPTPDPPADQKEVGSVAAPSDGRPRRALLTIPALDLRRLPVVPYRGWTDDAPGTAIQDEGVAASPFGPRGGVGPGGIGNYQVTAHRTSSTRAFEFLPDVERGDRVLVDSRRTRYVYEIRTTRETSFRSERSLARQRAAVPGRPRAAPGRAFITLSTCATPEDHAAGNYWADEFDNPEHRIDKIGVLVRTRATR